MVFSVKDVKIAIFAGGCFWCLEELFDGVDGVLETCCGYTGGFTTNPTYESVSYGFTGHLESVKVLYDASYLKYDKLLARYFLHIDPWDNQGQFCDTGNQYRSAIFYTDMSQKMSASRWIERIEGCSKRKVETLLREAGVFYRAEEYHQCYYKKCPLEYALYVASSGRREHERRMKNLLIKCGFEASLFT